MQIFVIVRIKLKNTWELSFPLLQLGKMNLVILLNKRGKMGEWSGSYKKKEITSEYKIYNKNND